jgi:hypothetical protein
MKLTTIASGAALLSAMIVFAGGSVQAANAVVPPEKCEAAWHMASPAGDTIAKGKVMPFVLDFTMVDTDKNGVIEKDEFTKACSAGMVTADEATVKNMK